MDKTSLNGFIHDEDGAVTVDWVVLTAAIVAMVIAVFTIITQQSVSVGAQVVSDNLVNAAQYRPDFTGGN
jgi:Flp pilus assembly pilin Flp